VDITDVPGRCWQCSIVLVVVFMKAQFGLVEICKKYRVIGKVELQALIGDPCIKNCWNMS